MDRRLFLKLALGAGAVGLVGSWPQARARAQDTNPWDQVDAILQRIHEPNIPQRAFPITRFGTVGDGVTDCSGAIAEALDACVAAGGGRVLVPEGTFLTGPSGCEAGSTFTWSTVRR